MKLPYRKIYSLRIAVIILLVTTTVSAQKIEPSSHCDGEIEKLSIDRSSMESRTGKIPIDTTTVYRSCVNYRSYPDSASLIGYTHTSISDPGGTRVSVRDQQEWIYVVFAYDWGIPYADSSEIYYSFSTNNGHSWSNIVNISRTGTAVSIAPTLAIDSNGYLHCVWHQYDPDSGGYDVFYSYYNGISWSTSQNISRQYDGSNAADYPSLVIDSRDYLYVVWDKNMIGEGYAIFYSYYNDTTWSAPYQISPSSGDDAYPALAVDGNDDLHLVWRKHGVGTIIYTQYDGISWTIPDTIAIPGGLAYHPCIVVDTQNKPHVTCMGGFSVNSLDIYYVKKNGGGWSSPLNLSSSSSTRSSLASLSIDSLDNLYVVWEEDDQPNFPDIFYRMYDGVSWSDTLNITQDALRSFNPKLGNPVVGNRLDLVWASEYDSWMTLEVLYLGLNASTGIVENPTVTSVKKHIYDDATIISGPLLLPEGKNCKVFDITGRIVAPDKIKPGIYFIEIDGKIKQKVVKIR